MWEVVKVGFGVLAVVWIIQFIVLNFLYPWRGRIPGDLYIKLGGINLYVPFVSSFLIAIAANLIFNFFRH